MKQGPQPNWQVRIYLNIIDILIFWERNLNKFLKKQTLRFSYKVIWSSAKGGTLWLSAYQIVTLGLKKNQFKRCLTLFNGLKFRGKFFFQKHVTYVHLLGCKLTQIFVVKIVTRPQGPLGAEPQGPSVLENEKCIAAQNSRKFWFGL